MELFLEIAIFFLEKTPGNKWAKTILFILATQLFTVFAVWVWIVSPFQSPGIAVDIVFWICLAFWILFTLATAAEGHRRNWQE